MRLKPSAFSMVTAQSICLCSRRLDIAYSIILSKQVVLGLDKTGLVFLAYSRRETQDV